MERLGLILPQCTSFSCLPKVASLARVEVVLTPNSPRMTYEAPADSELRPIQFNKRLPRVQSWWAPVWRGLLVEPTGKHYRAMHTAVWLYMYLVVHADRRTGKLFRRVATVAKDMGVKPPTIRRWLSVLVRNGYVVRELTGRSLNLSIQRWKPIMPRRYGSAARMPPN